MVNPCIRTQTAQNAFKNHVCCDNSYIILLPLGVKKFLHVISVCGYFIGTDVNVTGEADCILFLYERQWSASNMFGMP